MRRFGTKYGGFYYPNDLDGLNEESIIYCVGAGEDISHDIDIAHTLNSNVYIFDPTPRAITHVNYIKDIFDKKKQIINNKKYGGGDPNYLNLIIENKIKSNRINFYNYGLYTKNTNIKFYEPINKKYVSHSAVKGMKSTDYIYVQMKTLQSIMTELDHDHIDLLKIDIEGCECDVLEQMITNNIYPKYLSIDFDLGWTKSKIQNRKRCMNIIKLLLKNKYKIINNIGSDYSFKLQK
jgi:FkbM family methyltransferase